MRSAAWCQRTSTQQLWKWTTATGEGLHAIGGWRALVVQLLFSKHAAACCVGGRWSQGQRPVLCHHGCSEEAICYN